ncbi:MAG: hypothetical protein J1F71_05985 [Clostridiales bacterium]|nr:hypothetical protein [Clostridiales bacterium]
MTGKEIAEQSAVLLQDKLLINALKSDGNDDNTERIFRALKDALSEVSRDFPKMYRATVTAKNGVIPYSAIKANGTIYVKRVEQNKRNVPFTTDYINIYVRGDGQYTVAYTVDCFDADLSDELPTVREVGAPMLMHLTARNYCIMCGRMDEAAVYDSRYDEYAQSLRLKRGAHIPGRIFA